jgi:hypothetical protein
MELKLVSLLDIAVQYQQVLLNRRFQRAEEALARARAHYETLRASDQASERAMQLAQRRVAQLQQQMDDLQDEIDRSDDEGVFG